MWFVWLVIGAAIGGLFAWWYLNQQHERQADQLAGTRQGVEKALKAEKSAHGNTKR